MDDWIARAIASVKNYLSKDAVVAKEPLHCNRWIAASVLQKAIRRGDAFVAQRAAFRLYQEDRSAAWRRLIAIAFEDVGPGDIDVVIETVAAAVSPDWRRQHGEDTVFASITSRLALAPKDRSADYLMWVAIEHPSLIEARTACARAPIPERLNMVRDGVLPLAERAVAAWFSSGIDYPYLHRVGAGHLAGLADVCCELGVPDGLVSATTLAARRTRQPYVVLLPLVWLEVTRSGPAEVRDEIVPPSRTVADIPLYALDEHTRLGKRAINTLAQQNLAIHACLRQYVPRRRWISAAQHAAFYAEGSAVSRRLDWAHSRALELLGIEAELSTAEVSPNGVEPLVSAMRNSLDQLNAIRTQLLLTAGADAS